MRLIVAHPAHAYPTRSDSTTALGIRGSGGGLTNHRDFAKFITLISAARVNHFIEFAVDVVKEVIALTIRQVDFSEDNWIESISAGLSATDNIGPSQRCFIVIG